jgi:hypothetical protein
VRGLAVATGDATGEGESEDGILNMHCPLAKLQRETTGLPMPASMQKHKRANQSNQGIDQSRRALTAPAAPSK